MASETLLILDSARGVYIPQAFARKFKDFLGTWTNVDLDALDVLFEGPEHEWYWESWQTICDNAEYLGADGVKYTLYQDGDVWLVPEGTRFPGDEDWDEYIEEAADRQIDDFNQAYQSYL